MPYELIKKIVVEITEERPYPCAYCEDGWKNWDAEKKVETCQGSCGTYRAWLNGEIVIPQGFDEVREIKEEDK